MIVLYGNHCPRCNILEKKMKEKNIPFVYFYDEKEMIEMGMNEMPVLEVEGNRMGFVEANKWINSHKGE